MAAAASLSAVAASEPAVAVGPGSAPSAPAPATRSARLFGFERGEPAWQVVNDGVMGGVSESTAVVTGGRLVFAGRVRLENNGGFASVRTLGSDRADMLLAATDRVSMRVRGDGRTYQFQLAGYDGPWYWAAITPPAGVWSVVEVPYARFRPHSRFGEPLEPRAFPGEPVASFGFMIANKKAERFRLEVDWIDAGR